MEITKLKAERDVSQGEVNVPRTNVYIYLRRWTLKFFGDPTPTPAPAVFEKSDPCRNTQSAEETMLLHFLFFFFANCAGNDGEDTSELARSSGSNRFPRNYVFFPTAGS